MAKERLGVGIIGGGFIGMFHIRSWIGVRNADILGIFYKNEQTAENAAAAVKTII